MPTSEALSDLDVNHLQHPACRTFDVDLRPRGMTRLANRNGNGKRLLRDVHSADPAIELFRRTGLILSGDA